jgi:hypothetical protein
VTHHLENRDPLHHTPTPDTEMFRCLDQILSAHGAAIVRFSARESLAAMLAPVWVLTAKSPSPAEQVQIEGLAPKDPVD